MEVGAQVKACSVAMERHSMLTTLQYLLERYDWLDDVENARKTLKKIELILAQGQGTLDEGGKTIESVKLDESSEDEEHNNDSDLDQMNPDAERESEGTSDNSDSD